MQPAEPRGQGEHCKLLKWGVWDEAPAEVKFCTFYPQNLTSSGNDSNDFPDNQLAKFNTV